MRHQISLRKRTFLLASCICCLFNGLLPATAAESAAPEKTASVHAGFLYPNGVDIAGYTVEKDLSNHFYGFYTFGFPSFAAAGISYYRLYQGNGLTATLGVGIGSVLYTSLAYQLRLADRHYLKIGGGYATGVAYSGLYPALSYEFRLK